MWFVLDQQKIIEQRETLTGELISPRMFDVPSNMQMIAISDSRIEIRFYYYTGKGEEATKTKVRGSEIRTGVYSKRIFTCCGSNLEEITNNLLLFTDGKPLKQKLLIQTCVNAIELHRPQLEQVEEKLIQKFTAARKVEYVLQTLSREQLKDFLEVLIQMSNLNIKTIDKMIGIIELYLDISVEKKEVRKKTGDSSDNFIIPKDIIELSKKMKRDKR